MYKYSALGHDHCRIQTDVYRCVFLLSFREKILNLSVRLQTLRQLISLIAPLACFDYENV